jgi:hypothetical protein
VQQALPAPRRAWWSLGRLLPIAAAAAAVVVVGVVVGHRVWSSRQAPAGAVAPAASAKASTPSERVLLAALDEHFENTQTLLVELMNSPSAEGAGNKTADFSYERTIADELLSSGRLYRVTARMNGNTRFAGMLDDLEPVLVDVARSPERMNRDDLRSLRARIDDASLLFKVRAMSSEIRDLEKKSAIAE